MDRVLDEEIKRDVDPLVYAAEVGLMELALERDDVVAAVKSIREQSVAP